MFDYSFRPTHTFNGSPVQLAHSWTANPGSRHERRVLVCYDADRKRIERDADSFGAL